MATLKHPCKPVCRRTDAAIQLRNTVLCAARPAKHVRAPNSRASKPADEIEDLRKLFKQRQKHDVDSMVRLHARAAVLAANSSIDSASRTQVLQLLGNLQTRIQSNLSRCTVRHLISLLGATARARCAPNHLWLQSIVRELNEQKLIQTLRAQQLVQLMSVLSRHTSNIHTNAALSRSHQKAGRDGDGGNPKTLTKERVSQLWTNLSARAVELATASKLELQDACCIIESLGRARHYDSIAMESLLQVIYDKLALTRVPSVYHPDLGLLENDQLVDSVQGHEQHAYMLPIEGFRRQSQQSMFESLAAAMCGCAAMMQPCEPLTVATYHQLQHLRTQHQYIRISTTSGGTEYEEGPATELCYPDRTMPSAHTLVAAAWSAFVLGAPNAHEFLKIVLELLCTLELKDGSSMTRPCWSALSPQGHVQLMQAMMLCVAEKGYPATIQHVQSVIDSRILPQELLSACLTAWCASARKGNPSATQKQVAQALSHLGLPCQCEQLTDDSMFSLDILTTWKGHELAIEVDGPSHYCATPKAAEDRPLGATHARNRLLASRGLEVVIVNAEHWHRTGATEAETVVISDDNDVTPVISQLAHTEEDTLTFTVTDLPPYINKAQVHLLAHLLDDAVLTMRLVDK